MPGQKDRVSLVPGGGDRNDTIFKVVAQIEQDFGESDDHILVTHDSVRPFVTLRMLEENIDGALQYKAVDTVIPCTDTIVASKDGEFITDVPERRYMYQGQTPQSFNMNLLKTFDTKAFRKKKRERLPMQPRFLPCETTGAFSAGRCIEYENYHGYRL